MTQEELKQEIQLIFARSRADGLRAEADRLLSLDSFDLKKATATQYAAAFSSAFAYISERFTEGPSGYDEACAPALRSTPEAAPQASEASLCPELLSLLKTQKSTQERIDQLLAR